MDKSNELAALEAQIRECFGRVIYTHKTHSKMADRAASRLKWLKISQIALSSLTASGAISVVFVNQFGLKLTTVAVSLITVALMAYMKDFDLGGLAQKHRDTAADVWPVRESYLSLLTDIVGGTAYANSVRIRRDYLKMLLQPSIKVRHILMTAHMGRLKSL